MSFFALLDPDPTEQINADPFGSDTLGRDNFFFEEKQSRHLTNQRFFFFPKGVAGAEQVPPLPKHHQPWHKEPGGQPGQWRPQQQHHEYPSGWIFRSNDWYES